MVIIALVAVGKNYQMGLDNGIPWHNKEDFQFFKEITDGKTLLMGRKTVESLPRKLKNRKIICLTRNTNYKHPYADQVIHSIDQIRGFDELVLCGGVSIYKLLDHFNNATLYLSQIPYDGKADIYFPKDLLKTMKLVKTVAKQSFSLKIYKK